MNGSNQNYNPFGQNNGMSMNTGATVTTESIRIFMRNVFGWMAAALALSGVAAYAFATIPAFTEFLYGSRVTFYIVLFAPVALVLVMGFGQNRLSFPALLGIFLLYAALTGMSLSSIFLIYEMGSIISTFLISSGMFAAMAVLGFVTKADLTSFGRIMMMGLMGIVIASIVNLFMQSSQLGWIISLVGVAVFTGLTAYDVQKLKNIASQTGSEGEVAAKASVMGALTLYMDFINLFIMLLRVMGKRK
ncbi:MAG: Bax inhibitor-1/YccA family protein [Bacteroidia bacterium]